MSTEPDPARNRFIIISVLRLFGALMAAFGLIVVAGAVPSLPPLSGIIFVIIGMIDFLIVPKYLARKWKTPD